MKRKARISVCLADEGTAGAAKVAAKPGTSVSLHAGGVKVDHPARDGEPAGTEDEIREVRRRLALLRKMDRLRRKIGPNGIDAADIVRAGRRR